MDTTTDRAVQGERGLYRHVVWILQLTGKSAGEGGGGEGLYWHDGLILPLHRDRGDCTGTSVDALYIKKKI